MNVIDDADCKVPKAQPMIDGVKHSLPAGGVTVVKSQVKLGAVCSKFQRVPSCEDMGTSALHGRTSRLTVSSQWRACRANYGITLIEKKLLFYTVLFHLYKNNRSRYTVLRESEILKYFSESVVLKSND